jgi:hypothetical protein
MAKPVSNDWPFLFPEHERSLIIAYALWFLWGFLGLHKFYLGWAGCSTW